MGNNNIYNMDFMVNKMKKLTIIFMFLFLINLSNVYAVAEKIDGTATGTSNANLNTRQCLAFNVTVPITLINVTKLPSSTGSVVVLMNYTDKSDIASAPTTALTSTFNINLSVGSYGLCDYANGSTYNLRYSLAAISYPINFSMLYFTNEFHNNPPWTTSTAQWDFLDYMYVENITATPSADNIVFLSQAPSNVTSTSIFSQNINITYNYSTINLTQPFLYAGVRGGLSCIQFVNGTCAFFNDTYAEYSPSSNITSGNNSLISYTLGENDAYPYVTNLQNFNTLHSNFTMLNDNVQIVSKLWGNVSSIAQYNVLEIMATSTGTSRVYLCNDSYTPTTNVVTSANCQEIGNINTTTYNHTHTANVSHNLVPFSIASGKVSGIGITVTPTMWVAIRGGNSATTNVGHIPTTTRVNTTYTTINNGVTYTPQTYSVDFHIHQYTNNEYLFYWASGNYTGVLNTTAERTELIDVVGLLPTPPIITNPFASNQSTRYLNVTWLNASSNVVGGKIVNYLGYLNYMNGTLIQIFNVSNATNSFNLNVYNYNLTLGTYGVRVLAIDTSTQANYDEEYFNLTRNADLNITAYDSLTISSIENFTLTANDLNTSDSTPINATLKNAIVNIIRGNSYQLLFNTTGYGYITVNYTANTSNAQYLNQSLDRENSVTVYVRDEVTGNLITGISNVTFTGTLVSINYNATNGTLFVYNLTPDNYTVTVVAPLYSSRQYFITVTNHSTQTLNAFLTQSSINVILSYTDKATGVVLEGVNVALSRMINGTLTLVESRLTDVTGRTQFTVASTGAYTFTNTKTGYITKIFSLNPVLFTSYNVQMEKSTSTTTPMDLQSISVTYTPSVFVKSSNTFLWTISAPEGTLTNYGYNLTTQCKNLTGASGVNAYGSTLTSIFNLSCASNYDTVTLRYYYQNSGGSQRNFTKIIGITSTTSNSTITTTMKDSTYGLGLFERLLITVVLVLIIMGVVGSIGGVISSMVVGLLVLGYFAQVGFIPWSAIIITIFAGALLVMARDNR